MTVRVAVWSGPRNISTAMMRAWENREDCAVVDEPLYAHYLARTRLPHPGFDEIVASQSTDWRVVTEGLRADLPGVGVHYQKHMTHHMLPEVGRGWMADVVNVFLIRDPAEVAASYVQRRGEATLEDLGLPQQWELFEHVAGELGRAPIVVESRDILADPEGMQRRLCDAIGVPFSDRMLAWRAGPRASDGVWAKHWYTNVEASTGFQPPRKRELRLSDELRAVADAGRVFYDRLRRHRLQPGAGRT